jgi:hypothetical protein
MSVKSAQIPVDFMGWAQAQVPHDVVSSVERSTPENKIAFGTGKGVKAGLSPEEAKLRALQHELALNQQENTSTGLVSGRPYKNHEFFARTNMPEKVYVNVGGYGEGEGNPLLFGGSISPNPVLDLATPGKIAPEDTLSFQQSQGRAAQNAIDLFRAAGVPVELFGHSYGGDTAAHLAVANPDVPTHAIDPVSMFNQVPSEKRPSNLTVYQPYGSAWNDVPYDFIATVGNKYAPDRNTVQYEGGHVKGTGQLVDSIIDDSTAKRTSDAAVPAPSAVVPLKKAGSGLVGPHNIGSVFMKAAASYRWGDASAKPIVPAEKPADPPAQPKEKGSGGFSLFDNAATRGIADAINWGIDTGSRVGTRMGWVDPDANARRLRDRAARREADENNGVVTGKYYREALDSALDDWNAGQGDKAWTRTLDDHFRWGNITPQEYYGMLKDQYGKYAYMFGMPGDMSADPNGQFPITRDGKPVMVLGNGKNEQMAVDTRQRQYAFQKMLEGAGQHFAHMKDGDVGFFGPYTRAASFAINEDRSLHDGPFVANTDNLSDVYPAPGSMRTGKPWGYNLADLSDKAKQFRMDRELEWYDRQLEESRKLPEWQRVPGLEESILSAKESAKRPWEKYFVETPARLKSLSDGISMRKYNLENGDGLTPEDRDRLQSEIDSMQKEYDSLYEGSREQDKMDWARVGDAAGFAVPYLAFPTYAIPTYGISSATRNLNKGNYASAVMDAATAAIPFGVDRLGIKNKVGQVAANLVPFGVAQTAGPLLDEYSYGGYNDATPEYQEAMSRIQNDMQRTRDISSLAAMLSGYDQMSPEDQAGVWRMFNNLTESEMDQLDAFVNQNGGKIDIPWRTQTYFK